MTKKPFTHFVPLALAALLLATALPLLAENWPQFRGPGRDGISQETGLASQWDETVPQEVWTVPAGDGFAALAIVDGSIYTMMAGSEAEKKIELLVSLDAKTGKTAWSLPLGDLFSDDFGAGPRSTPLVHAGRVYAVGSFGDLVAAEAATGKEIWRRDLRREFGGQVPTWGVSASPILEGDLLIFDVGGKAGHGLMAFDSATGEVIWKTGTHKPGYSMPIAVTIGGQRMVINFTASGVLAVDPRNGKALWQQAWKTDWDVNAATPIFIAPNKVFISSGYGVGGSLYQLSTVDGQVQAKELWKNGKMRNRFSSSVYHAGHLYGFDEKTFKCIDAATGEDRWATRGLGHGSLFYADGHLYVLGENGTLLLVEATPEAYKKVSSIELGEGRYWSVPTLYQGHLYLRDQEKIRAFKVTA